LISYHWILSYLGPHSQILHDEISTLQLELGQIEDRNQTLTKDNAKLLQRWLDAKQAEANKMNEANEFYENMRSRHQAVLSWRDGSGGEGEANVVNVDVNNHAADTASQTSMSASMSGNEDTSEGDRSSLTKDGTPSPAAKGVDLTPNGWLWRID
jgi:autophagy-related protein 16-1